MAVYIVTGKLGNGKSLFAVWNALEYLREGRRVACNFPLDFSHVDTSTLRGANRINNLTCLPSKPDIDDLKALGRGGDREEIAGALILDESAMWLNSRTFQDKSRQAVIDWLLHSRKLGWDVYLIVQHLAMVDKQVRDGIAEHVITCMRLDRLQVPFIGLKLPRVHIAVCRYGTNPQAPSVWAKFYRGGADLFEAYATNQMFDELEKGQYCPLSYWHVQGRYKQQLLPYLLPLVIFFAAYIASLFAPSARQYLNNLGLPHYEN